MSGEQLLCSTASKQCTHLVEHLLFGRDLAFFGQIPRCTKGLTTRNYAHLYKRIGMFTEPADRGMPGFMQCDRTLLGSCHHLGFLL